MLGAYAIGHALINRPNITTNVKILTDSSNENILQTGLDKLLKLTDNKKNNFSVVSYDLNVKDLETQLKILVMNFFFSYLNHKTNSVAGEVEFSNLASPQVMKKFSKSNSTKKL